MHYLLGFKIENANQKNYLNDIVNVVNMTKNAFINI